MQPLSTKENNLFKQVVKEYELKNYKKGMYGFAQCFHLLANSLQASNMQTKS